jgi:hypothetical protein
MKEPKHLTKLSGKELNYLERALECRISLLKEQIVADVLRRPPPDNNSAELLQFSSELLAKLKRIRPPARRKGAA